MKPERIAVVRTVGEATREEVAELLDALEAAQAALAEATRARVDALKALDESAVTPLCNLVDDAGISSPPRHPNHVRLLVRREVWNEAVAVREKLP